MEEKWLPVPIKGFEEFYAVSNLGRFKSVKFRQGGGNPKVLKPKVMSDGYLYVRMNAHKGQQYFNAHRIVANAFIQNPNNKPQVNHINSVRSDNRVENLEWVTPKENIQHAILKGAFANSIAALKGRTRRTVLSAVCHTDRKAVGAKNQCKACYMVEWRRNNHEHIRESCRLYALKKKASKT